MGNNDLSFSESDIDSFKYLLEQGAVVATQNAENKEKALQLLGSIITFMEKLPLVPKHDTIEGLYFWRKSDMREVKLVLNYGPQKVWISEYHSGGHSTYPVQLDDYILYQVTGLIFRSFVYNLFGYLAFIYKTDESGEELLKAENILKDLSVL